MYVKGNLTNVVHFALLYNYYNVLVSCSNLVPAIVLLCTYPTLVCDQVNICSCFDCYCLHACVGMC